MRNFTVEISVGPVSFGDTFWSRSCYKNKKQEFKDDFVKQIRFRKNRHAGLFRKLALSTASIQPVAVNDYYEISPSLLYCDDMDICHEKKNKKRVLHCSNSIIIIKAILNFERVARKI